MKCDSYVIDLETAGLSKNARILQIAVVGFDSTRHSNNTNEDSMRIFNAIVDDHKDSITDKATIDWWVKTSGQYDYYQYITTPYNQRPMECVLEALMHWFELTRKSNKFKVYGNGVAFDNERLRDAYKRYNLACPFTYRQDACFRTIKGLFNFDKDYTDSIDTLVAKYLSTSNQCHPHNALYDALNEATMLKDMLVRINRNISDDWSSIYD